MGANIKEFLHLVEDFVNMIGTQMSGFQDIYEVTENIGELLRLPPLTSSQNDVSLLQPESPSVFT